MDFVFDRIASGRALKCLAIVDEATHEAMAVIPAHAIGGDHLVKLLEEVCTIRGRPSITRTDNGKEFTGRAMLTWAHRHGIALRLIELGKPNQNAYIESFNGRLREKCLNEHWFVSLKHARVIIRTWTREYNEEKPKRALGGLTPAQYAKQLAAKAVTFEPGLKSKPASQHGVTSVHAQGCLRECKGSKVKLVHRQVFKNRKAHEIMGFSDINGGEKVFQRYIQLLPNIST